MKRLFFLLLTVGSCALAQSCHPNPHNTFGGPSDAKDTATTWRDTNSVGTRTDR